MKKIKILFLTFIMSLAIGIGSNGLFLSNGNGLQSSTDPTPTPPKDIQVTVQVSGQTGLLIVFVMTFLRGDNQWVHANVSSGITWSTTMTVGDGHQITVYNSGNSMPDVTWDTISYDSKTHLWTAVDNILIWRSWTEGKDRFDITYNNSIPQ